MDLFDYMKEKTMEKESPLASRMRPSTLDEVVGQQHIIGRDKLLYRAIQADKLSSIIFYGPPGTGKTTLARVIANTTSAAFTQLNATTAGKKDMEEVVKEAQDRMGMYGKKTILFIDEIHRFNKGQQDYLLPFVEDGTVILIGATTENPYFEVNGALISRSVIFELKPLTSGDIKTLLERAVSDPVKGLGSYRAVLEPDAADFLADIAGGNLAAEDVLFQDEAQSAGGVLAGFSEGAQEQEGEGETPKEGDASADTVPATKPAQQQNQPTQQTAPPAQTGPEKTSAPTKAELESQAETAVAEGRYSNAADLYRQMKELGYISGSKLAVCLTEVAGDA